MEILGKDSELHQRECALLAAQHALEEVRQRPNGIEATQRSVPDFEEMMECLNDDLSRA